MHFFLGPTGGASSNSSFVNSARLTDKNISSCDVINETSENTTFTISINGYNKHPIISVISSLHCSPQKDLSLKIYPKCTGGSTCHGHHCIPEVAAPVSSSVIQPLFECSYYCTFGLEFSYISHIKIKIKRKSVVLCEVSVWSWRINWLNFENH